MMEIEEIKKVVIPWLLEEDNDEDVFLVVKMLADRASTRTRGPNLPHHGIIGYVETTVPRYSPEDFQELFHMSRGAFEVSLN